MDSDPSATSDKSNDAVSWQGIAASAKANQHVIEIGYRDGIFGFAAFFGSVEYLFKKALVFRFGGFNFPLQRFFRNKKRDHMLFILSPVSKADVELVWSSQIKVLRDFL